MFGHPLVSIIVPMYNVEKYIGSCIESIASQTFSNLEIILVDDGSPDKSGEIADNYAERDTRIRVIHQANAGVSAARNAGLDKAEGTYVCFVDGDDTLAKKYIENMVGIAVENDADFVISTKVLTSPDQEDIIRPQIEFWSSARAVSQLLYPDIPLGSWNKIYKRSMINGGGLRFLPKFLMGEGLNFIVSASQIANKVVATSYRGYYYRRNNQDSATTRPSVEKMKNALDAIENIDKSMELKAPEVKIALDLHYFLTCFYTMLAILNAGGLEENEKLYNDCLKQIRENSLRMLVTSVVSLRQRLKLALIWLAPELTLKAILYKGGGRKSKTMGS